MQNIFAQKKTPNPTKNSVFSEKSKFFVVGRHFPQNCQLIKTPCLSYDLSALTTCAQNSQAVCKQQRYGTLAFYLLKHPRSIKKRKRRKSTEEPAPQSYKKGRDFKKKLKT